MRLILLSIVQSVLLCSGQVLLKLALQKMGDFAWTWQFLGHQLTNWWWLGCISFVHFLFLWLIQWSVLVMCLECLPQCVSSTKQFL